MFGRIVFMSVILFPGVAPTQHHDFLVSDLHWLTGCWERNADGRHTTEQWMRPDGQTMLGMSRTVVNERTREYEFLRIQQNEKGEIHYIALPSEQSEASFKLVKLDGHEAVFENPEHDFPQRIVYRLQGDDLFARIEGIVEGKHKGIDFPMKSVKCE